MTPISQNTLVELNVSKLIAPVGDPRVQEFIDNIERINGLATRMPGYLWRAEEDETHVRNALKLDPELVWTLSKWDSAASLENFVWNTLHKKFFDRRAEWFSKLKTHSVVFWWTDKDDYPTSQEAFERLFYLDAHGPSRRAFGWDDLRANKFA